MPSDPVVACPHYPACPGCPWVGRPYREQLVRKRERVTSALTAMLPAGAAPAVDGVTPAPATLAYRAQTKLMVGRRGPRPILGLYAPGTHRVVDVSRCPLHDSLIQRAIPIVRAMLEETRVSLHGPDRRGIRYVVLRASMLERRLLVMLVTSERRPAGAARLAAPLRERLPVAGILVNENASTGNVIVGGRTVLVCGAPLLAERYGDLVLAAGPTAFVQANTRMAARIYESIAAAANSAERVLDLYSGVGGIALTLAACARAVVGVEEVPAAVEAARRNARRNRRANARFECATVERWLATAAPEGIDLVTLNPPRKGCGERTVRALAARHVPRLLYLSCNPESFGRDAAALVADGYALDRVQPFDLMPHTEHVELLGIFRRRSQARPPERRRRPPHPRRDDDRASRAPRSAPRVGPLLQRRERVEQCASRARQDVPAAVAQADDARVPHLPEPAAEHGRGDRVTTFLQRAEALRTVAQLPENAQHPSPSEQIEERHDGTARARAPDGAAWSR